MLNAKPVIKMGEIKTAKIATFKTAKRYGFDFDKVAADYAADYGWVFHRPDNGSMTIQYGFDDLDGETEQLYLVVAKCSCGCEFAKEYMMDELSALSEISCPDCGASTSDVDDSAHWKQITRKCN